MKRISGTNPRGAAILLCAFVLLSGVAAVFRGVHASGSTHAIRADNSSNAIVQNPLIIPSEDLETHKCGTLPRDETWGPAWGTYVLDCTVVVPVGTILTIQPGTVVQGGAPDCGLEVRGTLHANAEGGPSIRFTSVRDDPAGRRTNGDPTPPMPGDWKGIGFASSSRDNVLNNVAVLYAGAVPWFLEGDRANITSATRSLAITNSAIVHGSAAAISLTGPASLEDSIQSTTADGNALNGMLVPGGALTPALPATGTWKSSLPYVLGGLVVVPHGLTLTVWPGTVVKGGASTCGLEVRGSLIANGAREPTIHFTSFRDDEGNDTNGDSTAPAPGDWMGIGFSSSSTRNVLRNVEVRYGGGARWFVDGDNGNITSYGPSLTIRESQILNGAATAIFLSGPASLRVSIQATTASGNLINGLLVPGGELTATRPATGTWGSSLPYVLGGVSVVPSGVTLNIAPGTVVKGGASTHGLEVQGTLIADATQGPTISFTSLWDDLLNDTDGTATGPSPGDWTGIGFNSSSAGNILNNVEVRYGGGATWFAAGDRANINSDSSSLTISNSQVREGLAAAIFLSGPASLGDSIQATTASGNGINGLVVPGGDLTRAPPSLTGTWSASLPYVLAGTVVVPSGVQLKIRPGTVIKGAASSYGLEVRGTLNADAAGWRQPGAFCCDPRPGRRVSAPAKIILKRVGHREGGNGGASRAPPDPVH